jgi:guanosine-3',5'-bis(diphosphate) 3'-pyrophosphohydrolase
VDFAFDIHSKVGFHCIGAKIDGKIVPLDTELHSGDQVEIISSKNQHPNKNWIKFVKTQKAKNEIRKWLNKEEQTIVNSGMEIWEKKLKKMKLSFTPDNVLQIAHSNKFDNSRQFYKAIAQNQINIDEVLTATTEKNKKEFEKDAEFDKFANVARTDIGGILVDGKKSSILYNYAKCCNPIPGDPVIGYITVGEGIKIHRKTCANLINLSSNDASKLVSVQWPEAEGSLFVAGISIKGKDRPGILNDVSHSIVTFQNTNIKSININTSDSVFEGSVTVYVNNLDHLNRIIERLKKVQGIFNVERFESN